MSQIEKYARLLRSVIIKDLKINYRNKPLYVWVIGYPLFFIFIYFLAFNEPTDISTYSIAIINYDSNEDSTIAFNYDKAGTDFQLIFDPMKGQPAAYDIFDWKPVDNENQVYSNEKAMVDLNQKYIDAIIVIPSDFSEIVIGNCWWYPEFNSLSEKNQNQIMDYFNLSKEEINSSQFPEDIQINLEIITNLDKLAENIIKLSIQSIIDDLIFSYNNVDKPQIKISTTIAGELTLFDTFAPGTIIIGETITVFMIARHLGYEKEFKLYERLQTTPLPKVIHYLGTGISQLIYSTIQIIILLSSLLLFQVNFAIKVHWGLAFFLCLLNVLPLIGLGIIAARIGRNQSEAGYISTFFILPLQMLSGTLIPFKNNTFCKIMPTYYGQRAVKSTLLFGQGIEVIWKDMLILLAFGIVLILTGLLLFSKQVDYSE